MEREGHQHESESDNFLEKGPTARGLAAEVSDEKHGMMQSPMDQQDGAVAEDAANVDSVADIADGTRGVQKLDQGVGEGKSIVQQNIDSTDPMAGALAGIGGGTTEEGFKKGITEPNSEEEAQQDVV